MRYVTPFRLFFFLCLIAFFAIQIALNISDTRFQLSPATWTTSPAPRPRPTSTHACEAAIAGLETAKTAKNMPPEVVGSLQKSIDAIQKEADERRTYLKSRDAAVAKAQKPPVDPSPRTTAT